MKTDAEKTKKLRKEVAPFAKAELRKSMIQLFDTLIPLLFLWSLAYYLIPVSLGLSLLFSVISSGFIVRTFIIFHDCTHGSFFKNKKANDLVGNITGILTAFPYEKWKREHLIHHATSGNIDKRGIGDIDMLTVDEYLEKNKWQRFLYRLYRNPFVMFGLGPFYLLFGANRFNRKDAKRKERLNTYFTNIAIILMFAVLVLLLGWQNVLLVHGVSLYIAAALGIWLFYIQHTYEESYFEYDPEWDYVKAAVEGSSFYKLPKILQWITGNIGYHHVHHLAPRVPNYKLEEAHKSVPPLQKATTITLKTSLQSIRYKLYDTKQKKFVTFKEVVQIERKNNKERLQEALNEQLMKVKKKSLN